MPPMRKRRVKQPVTAVPQIRVASTAAAKAGITKPNNQLIRRYHTLNKELSRCDAQQDQARIAEIRAQLEELGGLEAYQAASAKGASTIRGGDTSRWLIKTIMTLKLRPTSGTEKLRLLDVGALAGDNYRKERAWIADDAVDLNPREASIQRGDFLLMPAPATSAARYDIVCLSLVVNFVGDIKQRGAMLRRVTEFLRPDGAGLFYLVLPLPCVTNSRYLDHDHLVAIVAATGLGTLLKHHHSTRLAYYLFHAGRKRSLAFPKREVRSGAHRNNFCIVLE
ncbi:putative methyltransferase-domain-containing protein [Thamnocephalis sphaerospora]|uniref:25S rRNA adenine-N(1) methyltransferase n=1 Tax=Thamnocephalis sphaerospora TaxID=78915 RepID=A0A4P9XR05_9FUNG|nr:putative methyltransferase-domain-containing protein [Thamnocephalis sphaerospora]|eukprot:RKP08494.1 putative methyltransferase-domain-containing protein [Thamnocephalis sphaerospora]